MRSNQDPHDPVQCCGNCCFSSQSELGDRTCRNPESDNYLQYVDCFEECRLWEAR